MHIKNSSMLQCCRGYDGAAWRIHVVDSVGITGRYTSMRLDRQGRPIIAYMTLRAAARSALKVAWAQVAFPNTDSDWMIYTVDSTELACIPSDCAPGLVCLGDSARCEPLDDPAHCEIGEGCAADQACVAGECRAVMPETNLDDLPSGVGLFADLDLFSDGTPGYVQHVGITTRFWLAG